MPATCKPDKVKCLLKTKALNSFDAPFRRLYVPLKSKRVSWVDKTAVLAVVKESGTYLQQACETLRDDKETVLAAVMQNGDALRWASPRMRADPEVVLAAVKNCGRAIRFSSEAPCDNWVVMLAAVKKHGQALCWASKRLKRDRLLKSWANLTTGERLLRVWRDRVIILKVTYRWQLCVAKRQEKERIANAECGKIEKWWV